MAVCDARVEQLRDKRKQWKECLDGEDSNCIAKQLNRMTWNITAFRVLMEDAVPLAQDAEEGGKQINRLLFNLLQDSFSESLLMALCDSPPLSDSGGAFFLRRNDRGVFGFEHFG
jgi:hypothetical protein